MIAIILVVFGTNGGRLILGFWRLIFGLASGCWIWNPEFGLRFSEWSYVVMVLQYFIARSLGRADIACV